MKELENFQYHYDKKMFDNFFLSFLSTNNKVRLLFLIRIAEQLAGEGSLALSFFFPFPFFVSRKFATHKKVSKRVRERVRERVLIDFTLSWNSGCFAMNSASSFMPLEMA